MTIPSDWVTYTCVFCQASLENVSILAPRCECEEYILAREKWVEDYRNDPDYQEPPAPEDYDKEFPVVYAGDRLIVDKDGTHKLKLEARQYPGGQGLCVWIPFPHKVAEDMEETHDDSGLAWDFTDNDAAALHDLLGEYLEKKQ